MKTIILTIVTLLVSIAATAETSSFQNQFDSRNIKVLGGWLIVEENDGPWPKTRARIEGYTQDGFPTTIDIVGGYEGVDCVGRIGTFEVLDSCDPKTCGTYFLVRVVQCGIK